MPADGRARLVVLLLPAPLEVFEGRELAERLLQQRGVVAVDPPRASYERLARLPDALGVSMAVKQARRLRRRLPGSPVAVVIFGPAQYLLARGLLVQVEGAELWYGPWAPPGGPSRMADLHLMATERAALVFDPHGGGDAVCARLGELALPA